MADDEELKDVVLVHGPLTLRGQRGGLDVYGGVFDQAAVRMLDAGGAVVLVAWANVPPEKARVLEELLRVTMVAMQIAGTRVVDAKEDGGGDA